MQRLLIRCRRQIQGYSALISAKTWQLPFALSFIRFILAQTTKHASHFRLERLYQSHIHHPIYLSSFSAHYLP